MNIQAIIFDLDGCLADSEPLALDAVAAQMRAAGLTQMTAAEVGRRFLGMAITDIADYVARETGRPAPPDFADRLETALLARYAADLHPMQGAAALLGGLRKAGLGMAIATGGSLRRMTATLRITGLAGYFQATACSAEEVAQGKPAPDLFLLAARRLGTEPAACVVLEDSPHGVAGAVAAGMRAVGFVGGSHLDGRRDAHAAILRDAGAETVCTGLDQVARLLLGADSDVQD